MGAALLIVVAVTHFGTELIARQFGADRAALFYVARGVEGVFLFGLLLRHSPLVAAVAAWGMIEEGMTSVCGALYIAKPAEPEPLQGLCDARLGMPVFTYAGLICALLLAASVAVRRSRGR